MLAKGLQHLFTDTPLTVLGLLLFLVAHATIVARIIWGGKDAFDEEAQLPLRQEMPFERLLPIDQMPFERLLPIDQMPFERLLPMDEEVIR